MVRDVRRWRHPISVTLSEDALSHVDRIRGDESRSGWIEKAIWARITVQTEAEEARAV